MFNWRSLINKGLVHGAELKYCFNIIHHLNSVLLIHTQGDFKLS